MTSPAIFFVFCTIISRESKKKCAILVYLMKSAGPSCNQLTADLQTARISRIWRISRIEINGALFEICIFLVTQFVIGYCGFCLLSESLDHHFGSIWRPLGPFWHHFGDQVGHRCAQSNPGRSQDGFWMIFDGFWGILWTPVWITFWDFLWFEASKSMFGL